MFIPRRTKWQLWLNVTSPISRRYLQAANKSYKNKPVKQMAELAEQHTLTLMPM